MSDCRKCAKFEECLVDEDCGLFVEKPLSNGDVIRFMSDYDLADWIAQILMYHGSFSRRPLTIDDNECPHECPLYYCCNDQPTDNIEGWLKSPAEKARMPGGGRRMSERQEKKKRYNLRLMWIADFDKWLNREPPMWKLWAWRRWKRERPVWVEVDNGT